MIKNKEEILKRTLEFLEGDEVAASVFLNKYSKDGLETPEDVNERMARRFYEEDSKYDESKIDKSKLSEYGRSRLKLTLEKIKGYFNSHTIIPQGSVQSVVGTDIIGSASNCFVTLPPEDSYGSILYVDETLVQLMKRRGGVGVDISKLRPNGAKVNNVAKTSSGAISFMERFSNTTREVSQMGRRGALMITIDVRHPDILDFIKIKRDLTKVTGANISVKLGNEFIEAVKNNTDFLLRFPIDLNTESFNLNDFELNKLVEVSNGKYIKKVNAKKLWNELIKSAHNVAEPGLMYWDSMIYYAPDGVYSSYKPVSTNPSLRWNTLVKTNKGIFNIKELAENSENTVLTNILLQEHSAKVFLSGKSKPLYKITFKNGQELYCTKEHKHPVLNNQGQIYSKSDGKVIKKTVEELKTIEKDRNGDRFYVPFYPDFEPNPNANYSYEDGFMLGFYYGDGWFTENRHQFGFSMNEDDEPYMGKIISNIIKSNRTTNRKANWTPDHNLHSLKLTVSDNGFVKYMEKIGFNKDKNVFPDTVWKGNKDFVKGFVDGLFSTDGYVRDITKKHKYFEVIFTSSKEHFIKNLQKLLAFYGIISTVKKGYSVLNGKTFVRYDLRLNGVNSTKFYETFKLTNKNKQDKMERAYKKWKDFYKDYKEYLVVKSVELTDLKEDVYDATVYDGTHTFQTECGITGNCGEIAMQPFDSCRLIATNLTKFVNNPFTEYSNFDFDKLYKTSYEAQRLSDDLVDIEISQVQKIINKIKLDKEDLKFRNNELQLWKDIQRTAESSRRTGSGITGLGDMLAMLGIKYDSGEALDFVKKVMKTKMKAELDATIDLAILRGTFKGWSSEREYDATYDITTDKTTYRGKNDWYEFIKVEFPEQFNRMLEYGRRNVSFSTVAPTGTISMIAGATSGIEPLFSPFYMRRIKVVGDERVDFIDDNGDKWREVPVLHRNFKKWLLLQLTDEWSLEKKNEVINNMSDKSLQKWFEKSPYYKSTANDIDPLIRNSMQGVIQKYVTHSISSTINLPSNISEEVVGNIYLDGYNKGLKGQTVYRDGARSGVLLTGNVESNTFEYTEAYKRPESIDGEVNTIQIAGKKYSVFVGLINNNPYEVFVQDGITKSRKGKIVKLGSGDYVFESDGHRDKIISVTTPEQEFIARIISGALRHGMHYKFIIEIANKSNIGIFDFVGAIKKALSRHLKNDDVTDKTCPVCNNETVVYEEGCKTCKSCGWSACG